MNIPSATNVLNLFGKKEITLLSKNQNQLTYHFFCIGQSGQQKHGGSGKIGYSNIFSIDMLCGSSKEKKTTKNITGSFCIGNLCNFDLFFFMTLSVTKFTILVLVIELLNILRSFLHSLLSVSCFSTPLLNMLKKYCSASAFSFLPVSTLNNSSLFRFSLNGLIVSVIVSLGFDKFLLPFFLGSCVFLCLDKDSDMPCIFNKLFTNSSLMDLVTVHLLFLMHLHIS